MEPSGKPDQGEGSPRRAGDGGDQRDRDAREPHQGEGQARWARLSQQTITVCLTCEYLQGASNPNFRSTKDIVYQPPDAPLKRYFCDTW